MQTGYFISQFAERKLKIIFVLGWLCLFFACTPKIADVETPVEEPGEFTATGETVIPDRWWTAFEDEQLTSLIDSALVNNFTLKGVWQQLVAAQAIRKQQASNLLPDLTAQARSAISRPQPDFAGGENTQIGLSAGYEVDLWGRIRANVDAEEFRIEANYFDYQTAAMSLSAEIASVYFQIIANRQQLNLAEQQIETNEKAIRLLRNRFGGGQVKGVDVVRQEQLLEQTRNLKIAYETNEEVLTNQLAVLTGQAAQNADFEIGSTFPEFPDMPSAGLPLELVRRRPDLQREYSLLLAADREMAAAVANKFPRLSLSLSTQARSNTFTDLFSDWAYTLGGNLVAPILDWGRLRAEVDRTEAVKQEQLYNYGQSVLTSFQEVEDAYIQELNQQRQINIIEKRIDMANKVSEQLRVEFSYGLTDYLDVLLSLEDQQQLQRDILSAIQEKYLIRVGLYRSLAGGFTTAREDSSEAINTIENE